MIKDDDDDPVAAVIVSCQGPPVCTLLDAEPAYMDVCLWCKRLYVMKDGTEVEKEPSRA